VTLITTFFLFVLGLSLGSFISVVIERIHTKSKGIFFGHSKCPECHHRLKTIDLIPLVSYIMLKGACRYCKKKFSSQYFYLELFTAVVITGLFFLNPFIIENVNGMIEVSSALAIAFTLKSFVSLLLIAIFFYDLKHLEIPDLFLFPFIALSFITSLILGQPDLISMAIAAVIATVFLGGQIFFSKGEWLGEGDLYIGLGMAALFGWQLFLVALVISYLIGGTSAAIFLSLKKVNAKSKVPFAPFLVLGTFITLFTGADILNWYIHFLWI
jgi:prepilin signal peptidase PulO-like enzyme (type II secretory pathway)